MRAGRTSSEAPNGIAGGRIRFESIVEGATLGSTVDTTSSVAEVATIAGIFENSQLASTSCAKTPRARAIHPACRFRVVRICIVTSFSVRIVAT
jgi:hypothetical protein